MKNNILKDALADAKSLQEVAIRNAKKALEENFTPHLKSMLTKKLEEMETEDMEENISEEGMDDDMSIEDILAEIEAMDDDLTEAEDSKKEKDSDDKKDSDKKEEDDSKEKEEDDSEKEEENEEETSIEDMSEEDLTAFIEEVIGDMVSKGELEPGETTDDTIADDTMDDDMDLGFDLEDDETSFEDEDEEINIDSLLEEYESEEELMEDDNIEEGVDATELTKIAQSTGMTLDAVKALIALAGFVGIPALSALAIITKEGISTLFDKLKSKTDSEAVAEEEEMVENLRNQLKETKLLNSKLFYTVEIFNQAKTSLNETQRLGVLKAFDKATSVKEAKLVYETLKDKFNSKSSLQERRRGSASKPMLNTTKKTVINENQGIISQDTIDRFQKIAGIK